MSIRCRSAAVMTALALVGAPATSLATPGESARPVLPEAAWTTEGPTLRPQAPDRSTTAAPQQPPAPSRDAGTRDPAAVVGQSRYVDGCERPGGDAFDIRRSGMGIEEDDGTAVLTLRVCGSGPQLRHEDWDGQVLVWRLRNTSTGEALQLEVAHDGGGPVVRGVGAEATASLWVSATDILELRVKFPSHRLPLGDGCPPRTGVGCLTVEVASFVGTSGPHDTMPDRDADAPVWPSACRPDIDPAAAGHVRVTTASLAAARDVEGALHAAGYRAERHPDAPYVEVPVGASAAVRSVLAAWDEVEAVTPVAARRATAVVPDDEHYAAQWYLRRIGMPAAWERRTGSGVGLAIVDNGVASDRPDLAGRVERGWDGMTNQVLPAGTHSDLGGHGTAVAGLAAAEGDDAHGIAGMDWRADIHPVRVFDHAGCFVSEARYLRALDWIGDAAVRGTVRVANFSLGGSPIPGERSRIARIVDNGAVVVAAMGNNEDRVGALPSYPAALPDVVAVGATGPDDELATYSNRGRHVDVVAPGGNQSGTVAGDLLTLVDPVATGAARPYAPLAGTSFSAPLVSGLASLYLAEYPRATPADVARALTSTARDLGGGLAGFDIGHGFGMVDAPAVLDHAPGQTLVRLAGRDRYTTAAEASARAFPRPSLVDTVVLATGENYPDALAGGPLAAREHAPLLLSPRDTLHEATIAELERLDPDRVLLLGGTTALSDAVAQQLAGRGYQVHRAAGVDRYTTAATIAVGDPRTGRTWSSWNTSDVVYVATGEDFPDALGGGAAAAAFDAPLLLATRHHLPEATRQALLTLRPSRVVVLGGEAAVGEAVAGRIAALGIRVDRAAGSSRYETAVEAICPVEVLCQDDTRFAVVATGEGFADALGGAAVAAALRAPLVLVPGTGPLPAPVGTALSAIEPEQLVILGGRVAITDAMAAALERRAVR